jgi:hypothetical protein
MSERTLDHEVIVFEWAIASRLKGDQPRQVMKPFRMLIECTTIAAKAKVANHTTHENQLTKTMK